MRYTRIIMKEIAWATRSELEREVVTTVQKLYAANGDHRSVARTAERAAVKALDAHIREHGCKSSEIAGFHVRNDSGSNQASD